MIDELDIRRWKNIVGDDTDKLWLVIKRKMKEKVRLFQVHRWRLSKEGKTLKKYKNDWWVDLIIQDVDNPLVHEIRRMRLGCSKLRNHMNKRNLRNCTKCDLGVPETNEHFFEVCNRYQPQRRRLKNDTAQVLKFMKMEYNTINLLGMNLRIMQTKNQMKKYKRSLLLVYEKVLKFIEDTARFIR